MEKLVLFKNEMFGEVRVIKVNNEPWFLLPDVCNILELSNPTMCLQGLDEDEKAKLNLGLRGGDSNIISESGLYTLIVRSRKREANQFRKWVTGEVLPSIRKHGVYATPQTLEQMLSDPDSMITVLQTLKQERLEKELALKQKSEIQTTLNCVVEQGITIEKFNQLFNKIIRKVAEVKFNKNYASAYNHFYDFLNYKIEINIRLRRTNAIKKLTAEHINNGKNVPKTLSKKVTLTSVVRENEYDEVIKTLKCWAVDLGVDIVNIDKL